MTRGHPPVVAIEEAMHYAERIGFQVIEVHAAWLASDFMAISEGKITRVRVRRLRSRALWTARYRGILHPGDPGTPQHARCRRHRPRALGPGAGQVLAPVCRIPGQDRNYGDVRHVCTQAPGTADASGRVTGGGRDSSPFYYLKK